MEYNYPILNKIFNHYNSKKAGIDLSNLRLYSCTHILLPQVEMYKMFINFGIDPKNITVLGKVYSSNKDLVNELRLFHINVIQPNFSNEPFDVQHSKSCISLVSQIDSVHKNIVLDDGGYLLKEFIGRQVDFGVEQTSSGFRKLQKESFNFPIYNVARSKTKLVQESPLIGRLVFERISNYINENKINSPKILIVGLGPIGESVYQILKLNKFNVLGFDIEVSKSQLINYLNNEKPDLIIGATGTNILTKEDLDFLKSDHLYHMVSVSSSDVEFPVANYRNCEDVHKDVVHDNFIFVNNGFPITFKGNKVELTPIEIEKTIGLLMGSIFEGIVNKPEGNYFIDIPEHLETLINS